MTGRVKRHIGKKGTAFLASYGLSCVLFLLLFVLVLLGTLEQTKHGLYDVQKKYFSSFFLIHNLFDTIPVPLPGAYLLMALLFVNLLLGGIMRAPKGWGRLGILIAHAGILLLLTGALIQFEFADNGHMTLFEGSQSSEFESYYDWEIAIADATGPGPYTEFLIPGRDFLPLKEGRTITFSRAGIPFDVVVREAFPNTQVLPTGPDLVGKVHNIDGFHLKDQPLESQAERNVAGVSISLTDQDGGEIQDAILWGLCQAPLTVTADGSPWVLDLRKKRYALPFSVTLDRFTRELHPGTGMSKTFTSEVTKTEDGASQAKHITMNAPLRAQGYTMYQASWGPANAQPGQRLYSVLAVVRNPADQFPLYACVIISLGLVIHFTLKLLRYLRAESRRSS